MQKSDSIAALAAALANAQGEMENAGKNSLSPNSTKTPTRHCVGWSDLL